MVTIRPMFSRLAGVIVAAIAVLVVPTGAWPQSRTIRIVVPFAPAGGSDILARLVANHISRVHGPTVVVENRPGPAQ
jgi:tripartite-type tricarboxylate transporter receptor subunit TctC